MEFPVNKSTKSLRDCYPGSRRGGSFSAPAVIRDAAKHSRRAGGEARGREGGLCARVAANLFAGRLCLPADRRQGEGWCGVRRRWTSSIPTRMPATMAASTTPISLARARQGFRATPSASAAVRSRGVQGDDPPAPFAKGVPRVVEMRQGGGYLPRRLTLSPPYPARKAPLPMIVGLGIDLVRIDRVWAVLERKGNRALRRFFTAAEAERCAAAKHPPESFAARFAAKE